MLINGNIISSQCISGYTVKNGKCSLICSDNNCLNCSNNSNVEVCNECKEGYKAEGAKCVKCQETNCIKCDYNKTICTQCDNITKLFNGI